MRGLQAERVGLGTEATGLQARDQTSELQCSQGGGCAPPPTFFIVSARIEKAENTEILQCGGQFLRRGVMAKLTKLKRVFHYYNWKYFEGRLDPDTVVKWAVEPPATYRLARASDTGFYGCFTPGDPGTITVHRNWKKYDQVWKASLLHEMAHLATEDEQAAHGPRWLRKMKGLVRRGAFDKLF